MRNQIVIAALWSVSSTVGVLAQPLVESSGQPQGHNAGVRPLAPDPFPGRPRLLADGRHRADIIRVKFRDDLDAWAVGGVLSGRDGGSSATVAVN